MFRDRSLLFPALWCLALLPAYVFSGNTAGAFLIGWYPSMIVHELGHMIFSWLAGIPALSFFFASFSFSDSPVAAFVAVLLLIEGLLIYRCLLRRALFSVFLLSCIAAGQLYFLLLPTAAVPLSIWGGVAAEFILPCLLAALIVDLNLVHSTSLMVLHSIASMVFWRSTLLWIFAVLKLGPIPYPRDASGGIALFQDPFATINGQALGDMDKLITIYSWSEAALVRSYCLVAAMCVLFYLLIWYVGLKKCQNTQPDEAN